MELESAGAWRLLYEGKSKRVYDAGDGLAVMEFKDEVTAFNGRYRDEAPGKGELSAALTSRMFEVLEEHGVPTHYVCYAGGNRVVVRLMDVLPLEVTVRNYAYGGMVKRMPLLKPLTPLPEPLVELHYKSDELGDPLLHPLDPVYAGLLGRGELEALEALARKVDEVLTGFWGERGLRLIDFKLEVARGPRGFVVVDEVTGDTMRLLDAGGGHVDKEVYRRTRSVEALLEAYRRLLGLAGGPVRRCEEVA